MVLKPNRKLIETSLLAESDSYLKYFTGIKCKLEPNRESNEKKKQVLALYEKRNDFNLELYPGFMKVETETTNGN